MVAMLLRDDSGSDAGGVVMVKGERGHSSEEGRQQIATARETMQFRSLPLLPLIFPSRAQRARNVRSTRHSTTRHRVFQWRIDSVTEMTRSRVRASRSDLSCTWFVYLAPIISNRHRIAELKSETTRFCCNVQYCIKD